jgi:type I restriction enzyme S subunit
MNGKQLKNSILQWAIQGKLVPQDPNDEPASVLLEKIRTEKARLVKEGKIKKDKNESFIFRGDDNSYYEKIVATGEVKCINDEIPFEIPQGWEWCRLSLLIYPPKYGTSKKSVPSGLLPVLRMGNIQDGEIVFDKLVYSNDLDDNKKLLLQYGDLLFNRTNSAELVGKTAIFRGQRNAIFAGYLILLRPIFINSEYLNLLLNTPYARDYCNEVKTIGVQQCNINAEKISNLLIPVPNLHETVAIVEKVKNIALPIIKYGEFYQKLKHLNRELPIIIRKSILQEAIQGKLVPQIAEEGTARELLEQIKTEKEKLVREGKLKKSALTDSVIFRGDDNKYFEKIGKTEQDITDEIPFDIPNTWVWVRHNDLFDISGGSQPPKSKFIEREKEGYIRLFQIRDYGSNPQPIYIPLSTASKISQKGDILLARYGASLGKVFYAEYGAYNVALAKVIPLYESRLIFQKYIFLYYCSSIYQNEIVNRSRCAQAGFNKEDLNSLLFPLPPLSEQYRIVEKYEKAIASIMRG